MEQATRCHVIERFPVVGPVRQAQVKDLQLFRYGFFASQTVSISSDIVNPVNL